MWEWLLKSICTYQEKQNIEKKEKRKKYQNSWEYVENVPEEHGKDQTEGYKGKYLYNHKNVTQRKKDDDKNHTK